MKVLKDYLGREVRLTDERLKHILEHPEMRGLESLIETMVAEPELANPKKGCDDGRKRENMV